MSELFMECEEEELEPWQKQVPEVNLVDDDDDDDEPIFVGELVSYPKNSKPIPPPVQRNGAGRQEVQSQPTVGPTQIILSTGLPGNGVNMAQQSLTIAPQPVIVNNQGFIVTPQQLSNADIIASLGKRYPPGTSFTILPAGQQHLLNQIPTTKLIPGVVHRPQVKQIDNNVVTLSNVQSPAIYSASGPQLQSNLQSLHVLPVPVKADGKRDQGSVKQGLFPQQNASLAKKAKLDLEQNKVMDLAENPTFRKKCPACKMEFIKQEAMQTHMMSCCPNLMENVFPSTPNTTSLNASKRIMLVSEFYYGRFEGDWQKQRIQKTNTTFKCHSCLKVLKNNIRFMNHMKHHLELEKQNSESWESYTTCQHCYRQYLTPFQLQCHIESAHSRFESSTNCKICELAFESEQVLLEHMKDNHKPGEMPYMCQVCNYRSSFYIEVEAHFRIVHENTKDLLCPFCLKVLRSGHRYMQHYMQHQKKKIHRCGKCRLNFLTYKERIDHKTHFHKTFKKPRALEGLPPGTKVTIRASLTGKVPPSSVSQGALNVTPEVPSRKAPPKSKSNSHSMVKPKPKKLQERQVSKKNLALKNLRIAEGPQTCIECDTRVKDFFSHYPMVVNCGACKYQTSCKVSIGNHMIRFHSTITKDRFWKMAIRKNPTAFVLTLRCLDCDLLLDASEADLMTKHLTENPHHVCRVVQEKDVQAEDKGVSAFGEPSTDLNSLTSTSAEELKECDVKQAESTKSGEVNLSGSGAAAPQPEEPSEQSTTADGTKEEGAAATLTESPSEGKVEDASILSSSPSAAGPPSAGPDASESLGNSEIVDTPQEPLVSPADLEHTTGITQTEVQPVSNQDGSEKAPNSPEVREKSAE